MGEQSLKEKTAKGLFWGGFSNGVQQLLGLFFGIYIARILDVEDYGFMGMLSIFTGIAGSIINSGFTVALINKKNVTHEDYNAVFWFTFFVGLFLYCTLYFCAPLIALFYEQPELLTFSRVLFLTFFFSGISNVSYTIMFKKLMVKQQAIIDITALLLSGVTGLTLALKGYSYWALGMQTFVYISGQAILRFIVAPWKPTLDFKLTPLKEMLPFSIKVFFTHIFNQINNNIITTITGKIYNAKQVGYFSQANKWTGMGNQLISGMLMSVAQPVFVQVNDDKERQKKVFRKIIRFTAFIVFPLFLGLIFISEEFILITIGQKWLPCVPILQILCINGLIAPFTNLYTQLILSHGKSNIYLMGNILQGILLFVSICLIASEGIYWMTGIYVIVFGIGFLFWHYCIKKMINFTFIQLLTDVVPYLTISLLVFFIVWFFTKSITNLYLLMTIKILFSISLYALILWLAGSAVFKESIQFLTRKKTIE